MYWKKIKICREDWFKKAFGGKVLPMLTILHHIPLDCFLVSRAVFECPGSGSYIHRACFRFDLEFFWHETGFHSDSPILLYHIVFDRIISHFHWDHMPSPPLIINDAGTSLVVSKVSKWNVAITNLSGHENLFVIMVYINLHPHRLPFLSLL